MGKSLSFYQEALGFELVEKWEDNGKLRWCKLDLGNASIMLQEFWKEGHHANLPEGKLGTGVCIYFICDDAISFYESIKEKQFQVMHESIMENLERGIETGFFRKSINKEFIARIYFNGMVGIKDKDIFPLNNFSMNELMNLYLEYHLRGISTAKGIERLENQLQQK